MNEEFSISLKTIFDQSSFDKIRKQLEDFKKEFEKGMEIAVSPAAAATNKISPSPAKTTTTPTAPMDVGGMKEYSAQIAYINSQILDLTETKRKIDLGIEEGDIFKVNPDTCTDCGTCEEVCPTGAIKPEE